MSSSPSVLRPLLFGLVAVALASQSGCAWVRSKFGGQAKYEDSVYNRPLEVPPGLDAPSTAGAMVVPDVTANPMVAAPAGVPSAVGGATVAGVDAFTMQDTVDSAWRRLGLALAKIDGVTIGDRAQLLNSYEVTYQGTAMLIRAEATGDTTRVVALGSNGQPLSGGAAAQLLGLLKARLG